MSKGDKLKQKLLFIGVLFFILKADFFAQDKSLYELLKENFKKKYLSIGLQFQGLADFQPERNLAGNNGFRIANLKLKIKGDLDDNVGYYIQMNFVKSVSLYDAFISYKHSDLIKLDLGQFKSPFSTEELTSSSVIDFVNRSQVVSKIAPGRQIGLQLSGKLKEAHIFYTAGIFNGNGINTTNDNQHFLYLGRMGYSQNFNKNNKIDLALNAGFSKDDMESFQGDRFIAGGDFRLVVDNILLSSEYIFQKLKDSMKTKFTNLGYHITVGYSVSEIVQLLARWDSYIPDKLIGTENNLAILGCNISPNEFIFIRINYLINPDDKEFKHHRLLVSSQLVF